MPLILPGNVASATAGAYDVANSCRFNDGDSPHMEKTYGTSTDVDKCTISVWVKRGALGGTKSIFGFHTDDNNRGSLVFEADQLDLIIRDSGSVTTRLVTTQVFRDVSAWLNIVLSVDTGQGTASSRVRLYVNGSEITDFGTETNPSQDLNFGLNNSSIVGKVGQKGENNDYFDGYMAEFVFIDGLQLTPSSFGEFDEDSPTIWKPKDVSGLTFGTNGFYLDFEDSSNLGNDANGGTDWSETNLAATDQATDTPTNNFSTWNSLYGASNLSYAQGNTEISCSSDGWFESGATIGISTGKWYYELKCTLGSGTYSSESIKFGICDASRINDGSGETQRTENHYQADGNSINDDTMSGVGTFATYTTNDIIGCAVDMTNRKIYYHKNGTYINSGNPSSGSNGFDISSSFDFVLPTISMYESGTKGEVNFGNPSFSISSGNADADGYGNFEYSVPSGFYALCTKNLAEYG